MEKLTRVEFFKMKVSKNMFWALNKHPEQLYGVVLPSVIGWLLSFFAEDSKLNRQDLASLSLRINDVFKHRGWEGGIRYVKACRLLVMKFLEGNPLSKDQAKTLGVETCSDTVLPKILSPGQRQAIVNGSPVEIRLIMTILVASRALNLGKVVDYSTIEEPRKSGAGDYASLVSSMEKYTQSFWQESGYQIRRGNLMNLLPKRLRFTRYHFTTKSGPNGHALFTSFIDFCSLSDSLREAICLLGGQVMRDRIGTLLRFRSLVGQILPEFTFSKRVDKRGFSCVRTIASFPDKENKVRVIGIGDYFSQTVLRPLHLYLFDFLKRIPQDCTFDQSAFHTKLALTSKGDIFVSADLSAATDRFPIEVIALVLRGRLPKWYVDAWETIMIKEPFWVSKAKRFISYAVGNPMGLYSSWASFAVAHHFIVYLACKRLGIQWKTAPYVLLGDDIVIRSEKLAKEYIKIMSTLGVEVSELKTHQSPHFLEFAKRLFYKGQEVSPFPISALQQTGNKFWLIASVLYELERKGAWVSSKGIPEAVSGWFGQIFHYKKKSLLVMKERVWGTVSIIKVMKGTMSGGAFLTEYATSLGYSFGGRVINDIVAQNVLANIAVELFTNSVPGSEAFAKKSKVPLGELATQWVCSITSLFDHPDPMISSTCMDLIQALPQPPSYGLVEEMYLDLIRRARRIDTVEGGNWPILLRTIALPLDDTIFVERTSRLIVKGSMLVSKHLKDRLEQIAAYPTLLDF